LFSPVKDINMQPKKFSYFGDSYTLQNEVNYIFLPSLNL